MRLEVQLKFFSLALLLFVSFTVTIYPISACYADVTKPYIVVALNKKLSLVTISISSINKTQIPETGVSKPSNSKESGDLFFLSPSSDGEKNANVRSASFQVDGKVVKIEAKPYPYPRDVMYGEVPHYNLDIWINGDRVVHYDMGEPGNDLLSMQLNIRNNSLRYEVKTESSSANLYDYSGSKVFTNDAIK